MATIDGIVIPSLTLEEQADDPATPASGTAILYTKSTGLHVIDDAGTVTGPLGSGGASSGAWTTYTPTWTGATVNPTIGNGTLSGAYRLDGKTLFLRIRIAMGSTTTYGTGTWSLALPSGITAKGGELVGNAYDASAAAFRPVGMSFYDGATAVNVFGASAYVSSTQPFTWASGDALSLSGVIEVQ